MKNSNHPFRNNDGLGELTAYAAQLRIAQLPEDILSRAKACLLYVLAVGMACRKTLPAQLAAAMVDAELGGAEPFGQATRLLDGRRFLAGQAAFANAALLHARIQEDAHPTGHVGVVVVPAALAVAQWMNCSGPELLCALVSGYEVALRIGRDHTADASTRGFRSTSLYGVFGAATAAAKLMGLRTEQMRQAIAIAANLGCGLREFVNGGTEEYTLHAGFAARHGIAAALCARVGARAAATTLEGGKGFYASYGMPEKSYNNRLSEALGTSFELREVTYKPYPACQFLRGVIAGILALRTLHGHRQLERMRILLHPFEADFIGVRYAGPYANFSQTFMSAPFCAALAWAYGDVTYEGLHAFNDERVTALIARIEVVADTNVRRYQPQVEVYCTGYPPEVWRDSQNIEAYALTWEAAMAMAEKLGREAGSTSNAIQALITAANDMEQVDQPVSTVVEAACTA